MKFGDNSFEHIFGNNTDLEDARDLKFDVQYPGYHSFRSMFQNSKKLKYAPELTGIVNPSIGMFYLLFDECKELIEPPSILPLDNLPGECYFSMFSNCAKLSKSPKIFASKLLSEYKYYFTEEELNGDGYQRRSE